MEYSFKCLYYFFSEYEKMNGDASGLTLPPLKKRHERKSFATDTLKKIHSRLQYYRKVLKEPMPTDPKKMVRRERIQKKYDRDMKVRQLLYRAINNRYI